MEGSAWLRVGLIGLLTAGAVYVLLPSMLDAERVDVGAVVQEEKAEPSLEVRYAAVDGSADEATASAVADRLRTAGVAVQAVRASDDRVVVYLATGTRKDAVEAVLAAEGRKGAWPASAAGIDPTKLAGQADVAPLIDVAVSVAELAPEAALDVGALAFAKAEDGSVMATVAAPPDASLGPVILAVDGKPVGWLAAGAQAGVPSTVRVVGADPAASASLLLQAPLPEAIERVRAVAAEAPVEQVEQEASAESVSWWRSMLPNTRISQGLDLQGGIDLTLQVDQEAAVVAAVQRDRRTLLDRAVEDGKTLDVQRDRSRFALELRTEEDLSVLQEWVDGQLRGEYVYVETIEREGSRWNVWEMAAQRVADIEEQAVEQNLETLRKRIDATGVKEPTIVRMGGGRINIQLPGVSDTRQATDAIGTQATLEFRMVDDDADQNQVARAVDDARRALPEEQFKEVELLNEWLLANGRLPDGRIVMWEYEETSPGKLEPVAPLQLKEEVVLTGADVENAGVGFDQNNLPRVLMDFKARGAQIFCDVTKANVGKRFAIILDGEIRSAPSIREAICGGSASIEMGSSANAIDEANTLALVLRSGALTAPVDIGEVREIGASLGADAIRSGTVAAAIGGVLVALFMLVWFRVPGIIANVALALNVLLVFALLALFGATLTLPGIAGIALTVGMAVDANIIIYERIREELRLGVSAIQAVEAGYDKALSSIMDSNLTTAFAGIVLYSFGTGPIKGFAVTLLIGIVTTLVTALYVTRTFMDLLTRNPSARLRL